MPREIFLPLAVDMARDPKVRALARYGRDARGIRDLYVQMSLYCKERLTDGHVPGDEIGVLVYPDPFKNGIRDADRLCEVGLIERTDGGYFIPAFLKRNKTKDQVDERREEKRRVGEIGNHNRYHVDGKTSSKCSICLANGSQHASA